MKRLRMLLLVIVCVMIGFSCGYLFKNTENKDITVIEQSSNMEVYEEFASNKILEVYVDTVNVNLQVIPSNNRNIRLVYRPSMEPSNFTYSIENKILYMSVNQVETSNSLVPSEKEMVYLYLPENTDVILNFTSETGFLDIHDVDLRKIYAETKSGIVSMSKVDVALDVDITTVSGKVILKEMQFDNLNVKTNTALVSCVLSLEELYHQLYTTKEGMIKVNDLDVKKQYEQNVDVENCVHIETRSGDIHVKVDEVYEDGSNV